MYTVLKNSIHIFGKILITIGLLFFVINFIGFFHFTKIEPGHIANNSEIENRFPRTISAKEFWKQAYKKKDETESSYVLRLTSLINDRLIHMDSKHLKPTFFENWIMWRYANKKGWYEWTDTEKAIRAGGGFCSQHAIVLNNILREQGIESHIIGINGHVLNEVLIDGRWRVYDPDYKIAFDHSLAELENNPELVAETYRKHGWSDHSANSLKEAFASKNDNWHYKTSLSWGDKRAFKESASLYLIWFIPGIFILLGSFLNLAIKNSNY